MKKIKKNTSNFKKILNGFFAGIIPAVYIYMIFIYLFLDIEEAIDSDSNLIILPFFVGLIIFIAWSYYADSIKRIWARMLLSSGIMSFIFPIAMFVGVTKQTLKETGSLNMIGTAFGGGVAVLFVGFLCLLLGLAFSIGAYFTYRNIKTLNNKMITQKQIPIDNFKYHLIFYNIK